MIDEHSRYYPSPDEQCELPDGRVVRYKRLRLLPQSDAAPAAGALVVQVGDRLDSLAARYLGSGELYWRICDANDVVDPSALVLPPDARLRAPRPPATDEPTEGG